MLRSTVDQLAQAPVGRYVAGRSYAHFCAAPSLWGLILWGRPDREQARALGRSLVLELGPTAQPHVSIIDASRLESGSPLAFRAAERYLERYRSELSSRVERLALVRPRGLGGAIVAGAFEVLPRPYPVAVFAEVDRALTWLDPGAGWLERGAALLEQLYCEASGASAEVAGLLAFLDRHLAEADLAAAARALGTSERSLQRHLGGAGTSFQRELAQARVRAACRLLVDSDLSLTAIAAEVGCASPSHFSALFRRHAHESPSGFRRRHRD